MMLKLYLTYKIMESPFKKLPPCLAIHTQLHLMILIIRKMKIDLSQSAIRLWPMLLSFAIRTERTEYGS